ncbi:MAG: hypothetical protein ACI8P0_005732 [Planctomycetaceae bacterium]|jgi:hypothetical protein
MLTRFFVGGGIDWGLGRIGGRSFPGGLTAGLQLLAGQQFSTRDLLIRTPGLAGKAHAELLTFGTTNRTIGVKNHRNHSLDFARPNIGGA